MKTKAVRLYGVNDIRTEEFELPPLGEDQILARVISDSICMSSHKAALQGAAHKRVPDNVAESPIILGHEFCGELIEVGKKWQGKFKAGDRFAIQPAINYKGSLAAPGYSYHDIGGGATYVIIPNEVMECNCLLPYRGEAFYWGSLAEPMSCIVGAFHANYHTDPGKYEHHMGTVQGGAMAILAGAGPMGLGAVDYAIHGGRPPSLLVVTDIDAERLSRAASLITAEEAKKHGVDLRYINTADIEDPVTYMKGLTGKDGFDDVFVFAPVASVVETADAILGRDGCLNFFAGPTNPEFTAKFNFYNVHYASTHIVGTSGGNNEDLIEALRLMEQQKVNPSCMITHIGGLDADAQTTIDLPKIPGGKKLIYTHVTLPLTAIADFRTVAEQGGEHAALFADLADICERNNNLWCPEAEKRLLRDVDFTL